MPAVLRVRQPGQHRQLRTGRVRVRPVPRRNVYLREQDVLGALDNWLNLALPRHRLADTVRELFNAQPDIEPAVVTTERTIKACDAKLKQHRRALEAGADPVVVAEWMREVQAQRAEAVRQSEARPTDRRLSPDEMALLITSLSDSRKALASADINDKTALYKRLGLKLTYLPGQRTVRAETYVDPQIGVRCPPVAKLLAGSAVEVDDQRERLRCRPRGCP